MINKVLILVNNHSTLLLIDIFKSFIVQFIMDPNEPANQDSGKACGFSGPLQLGLTSSQTQPTSNDPPSQLSGPRSVEPGEPLTQPQISTESLQVTYTIHTYSAQVVRITVIYC